MDEFNKKAHDLYQILMPIVLEYEPEIVGAVFGHWSISAWSGSKDDYMGLQNNLWESFKKKGKNNDSNNTTETH